MKKIFVNWNHFFYFSLLLIATIWLAVLHWVINPNKLAVWIYASDFGYITIESRCKGQTTSAHNAIRAVVAGHTQYEFSLPRCHLSTIEISSADKQDKHYELSSAAVTHYGKEVHRLSGNKRTLEGEGLYSRDSRPSRAGAAVLSVPFVLNASDFDSDTGIMWPRYLPFIFLPFAWWFSRMLAERQATKPKTRDGSGTIVFPAVAAVSLIAAMAVIAKTDVSVHPDELTHVASARYYYNHWLKPKIGAPQTLDAHKTNVYGVAYLTGTDPVYLLASKFAVATWPIFENDVIALRMFNVTLFGLLVLLAFKTIEIRLALIPLLVTPQAWYIFSYFNGEALPLFLSTLVVAISLGLAKNFYKINSQTFLKRIFILGCLVGGILLSKPNYWAVLGSVALLLIAQGNYLSKEKFLLMTIGWLFTLFGTFLFLDNQIASPVLIRMLPIGIGVGLLLWSTVILIRCFIKKYKTGVIKLKPVAIFLAGLFAVLGLKMADEAWQNPLPFTSARSEAINAVAMNAAQPGFKPNMEISGMAKNHRMRDKGIGLSEVLFEKSWLKASVTSFLGVYENLNIWPSKYFSQVLFFMFTLITVMTLKLVSRSPTGRTEYVMPISLSVGFITVVAASIGFSWIYDYQPQGKYLLPILPILAGGLVLAGENAYKKNKPLQWVVVGAFLLSAMSFLLVGMRWIPKQPGIY